MAQNALMQFLQPSPRQKVNDQLVREIQSGDPTARQRHDSYADTILDLYGDDPTIKGYEATAAGRAASNMRKDPDVAHEMDRQAQEEYALKTGPAQVAGDAAVRAAEVNNQGQHDVLQSFLGLRNPRQSMSISGVGSIGAEPRPVQPTGRLTPAQRTEYTGLLNGKIHAPGGSGMIGSFFGGKPQADVDRARITELQALDAGGGQAGGVDANQVAQALQAQGVNPDEIDIPALMNDANAMAQLGF